MKNNKYGLTVTSIKKYGFKKALEIWEKYDKKCSVCGSVDNLAVHHIDGSGKSDDPNNDSENLQLICQSCHGRLHAIKRWERQLLEQGGYLKQGRENEYMRKYNKKENRKEYMKVYMRKYRKTMNAKKD